jgi:hypothetical protein
MSLEKLDDFYLQQKEPTGGCLLALRDIILSFNSDITETRKYGMPCFCYKNKAMAYLWKDKKSQEPYILFVDGIQIDHPALEQGDRARMKILPVDPDKDIPIKRIQEILVLALELRRSN